MANGEIAYTGPKMADASLVTADELASGKVQAPEGTTPYTVQPGDNLSKIATTHGYGNPPNMQAFYADNKQYEQRNPDLIYPGETVFVKPPTNGTTATGQTDPNSNEPVYQNYKDGKPAGEPYSAQPAPNGAPTNSEVVDGNGRTIRTDGNGEPLTGDYSGVDEAGKVGNDQAYRSYTQHYTDGIADGPKHYAPGRMF